MKAFRRKAVELGKGMLMNGILLAGSLVVAEFVLKGLKIYESNLSNAVKALLP